MTDLKLVSTLDDMIFRTCEGVGRCNSDIDYSSLPDNHAKEMEYYILRGQEPGGCLKHILENDFVAAWQAMDNNKRLFLQNYSCWLTQQAPAGAWGSPERIANWKQHRGLIGMFEGITDHQEEVINRGRR